MNPNDISWVWVVWLDLYELATDVVQIFNTDLVHLIEILINEWFGFTIDIPFSIILSEWLTTPLLITLLALGISAFVFRCVKDIVNPFN